MVIADGVNSSGSVKPLTAAKIGRHTTAASCQKKQDD
jgi:hypothetical protein